MPIGGVPCERSELDIKLLICQSVGMAYEHKNLLIRLGGHFGSSGTPLDMWSTGFRLGSPVVDTTYDPVKLLALVTSISAALTTLHGSTAVGAGATCFVTYISGARVGLDGRYDPDTQETIRFDRAPLPGVGVATQPWNTSHVISLRTARPRGYASNGRVYYPMLAPTLDVSTGRLSSSTITNRLGPFETFFNAVNTAANTYEVGTRLVVASSVGAGRTAVVTGIRADGRLDSIERRENQQPASYVLRSLA